MTRTTYGALALLASLGLVACSDDGTGTGSDQLTAEEAAAIAEFVMTHTMDAASQAQASPQGPMAAPYTYESQVDFNAPCPLGGSVDVSGTVSVRGDTEIPGGTVGMAMVEVHNRCVGQDEATGQTFTLDGKPDLTVQFTMESDAEGNMDLSGSFQGVLAWQTEGRGGDCEFSLTFSGAGSQATGASSGSVSGSVCGVNVSEQFVAG